MQEQNTNMVGRGMATSPDVNEARVAILERRDAELDSKHNQRDELERRIKIEQERFEDLVHDRDTIIDAFAVSINACELRLDALRRALSRHHEDDPEQAEKVPSSEYARPLDERMSKAARTDENAASRY